MSEFEFRAMAEPVEFRSDGGTKLVASGVAIRYGVASQPFPRDGKTIREEFRSGAFTKSLAERPAWANLEHRAEAVLGTTGAGTMRIHNGDKELAYEIDLPDTGAGRDAAVLLERKDMRGSSVGFRSMPKDEQWSVAADGFALRSVGTSVLDHIALTARPVHETSSAALGMALRSLSEQTGIEVRSLVEAAASDLPGIITAGHLDERSSVTLLGGAMTFDDIRSAVQSAVIEDIGADADVWVQDLTGEWVVYQNAGELYQRSYSIDKNGSVVLGTDPTKVVRETTYKPDTDDNRSLDSGSASTVVRPRLNWLYA